MPKSIMMGDIPLPWVDGWNHLGNELNRNDLCWQGSSHLDHDTNNKRRKFIGKYYSLRQEFGFLKPDMFLKIINTVLCYKFLWKQCVESVKPWFWKTLCKLEQNDQKYLECSQYHSQILDWAHFKFKSYQTMHI